MATKVSDHLGLRKVHLAPAASNLWFMVEQQRKRRGAVEMGPTSATVAANVRRIRDKVRGMSTYELAGKLDALKRPIAPSAISKIERGERQVTVDDLMSLAYALGVNPNALLLPYTAEGLTELTGAGTYSGVDVWDWAEGERPLDLPEGDDGTAHNQFQADARPAGRRKFVMGAPTEPVRLAPTSEALAAIAADRLRYEKETGESVDSDTFRRLWLQARLGVKPDGGDDG